jgi:hypothetical protein
VWHPKRMEAAATSIADASDVAMRMQVLAVLEELCRDLTLHDVREWYAESMGDRF